MVINYLSYFAGKEQQQNFDCRNIHVCFRLRNVILYIRSHTFSTCLTNFLNKMNVLFYIDVCRCSARIN